MQTTAPAEWIDRVYRAGLRAGLQEGLRRYECLANVQAGSPAAIRRWAEQQAKELRKVYQEV